MKKNSCLPRLFAGCFPFACREKPVTNIPPLAMKEPVTNSPPLTTKKTVANTPHKLVYIRLDGDNIVIVKKCIKKSENEGGQKIVYKERVDEEREEIPFDSLFKNQITANGNSIETREINTPQKSKERKEQLQKFIPSEYISLAQDDQSKNFIKFNLTPSKGKVSIISDSFEKSLSRFVKELTDIFNNKNTIMTPENWTSKI